MRKYILLLLLLTTPLYAGVISTRNVVSGVPTIAQDTSPRYYFRDTTDEKTMLLQFDDGDFTFIEGTMDSFVDEDDWVAGSTLFTLTTENTVRFPTMTNCNLDTNASGDLVCGTDSAGHSNGANCSAGNYPLGVDENGAVESCTADVDTTCDGASCNVTNTGTLDGYEAAALLDDTNTNAATICANGEFLNGDGTCDAGYLDADGVDDTGTDTLDDLTDNSLGDLSDVVLTSPTKNDHLILNGTNWVNAPDGTTFTFSCTGFSDGQSTTKLIGTGDWQIAEAISFTATYDNGPPTTADIKKSINGASYATINSMDGAAYTSGNNTAAVAYPSAKDQYLRFRLDSDDGVDSDIDYDSAIYFRNIIYWGDTTTASGFTEANVEALSGSATSNDYTISQSITATNYIGFSYPTSYTAMDAGSDYETDGGTDFRFNSVAIAMTQDNAALSITNSAGYAENYDVYVSDLSGLGTHTFVNSTTYSSNPQNYIMYGMTTTTSGYAEGDCESPAGDGQATATTDYTQVWSTVNLTGGTEYGLWCIPKRYGEKNTAYTFKDNDTGLGFDFQGQETVSITNPNGWTEDYYVYRTTNAGLGDINVATE